MKEWTVSPPARPSYLVKGIVVKLTPTEKLARRIVKKCGDDHTWLEELMSRQDPDVKDEILRLIGAKESPEEYDADKNAVVDSSPLDEVRADREPTFGPLPDLNALRKAADKSDPDLFWPDVPKADAAPVSHPCTVTITVNKPDGTVVHVTV